MSKVGKARNFLACVAFQLTLIEMAWLDEIEHYGPLRIGGWVDGVSILNIVICLLCFIAIFLPCSPGESRLIAAILVIAVFLGMLLLPALQPANGQ